MKVCVFYNTTGVFIAKMSFAERMLTVDRPALEEMQMTEYSETRNLRSM